MKKGFPEGSPEPGTSPEQDQPPLIRQGDRLVYRRIGGTPERSLLAFETPHHLLAFSTYGEALSREAKTLLKLHHPSIPELFQIEVQQGRPRYTIRDIGYEPFSSYLSLSARGRFHFVETADLKELSEKQKLKLIADCAAALATAHEAGCIHGQLSAADLFVAQDALLMTGFGRPFDNEEPLKTDAFDAWTPERSTGIELTKETDYFSWGSFAFRLLVGQFPFRGATQDDKQSDIEIDQRTLQEGFQLLQKSQLSAQRGYQEFLLALKQSLSWTPARRTLHLAKVNTSLHSLISDELSQEISTQSQQESWKTLAKDWRIYAALSALLILSLAFIIYQTHSNSISPRVADAPLLAQGEPNIATSTSLQLKVLAEPWAHVLIQGQRIETTPFAQPISLGPGRHEVVLEHPSAPREVRVIEGDAGETITLRVQMQVKQQIDWGDLEMKAPVEASP